MKHTKHLLIVAVVGLVVAVAAVAVLAALVPADFSAPPPGGVAYRASSLAENAETHPLVYAAEESCSQKSCHGGENSKKALNVSLKLPARNEKEGKIGHRDIACQACHGPAQSHVASNGAKDGPTIWKPEKPLTEEERAKLPEEEQEKLDNARAAFSVGWCLRCHQELAGRPESLRVVDGKPVPFPTISSFEKHRKDNEDNGDGTEAGCLSCHSPHKPAM